MTVLKRYIVMAVALIAGCGVWGQGLQKEISVTHEDEPERREVSKLALNPVVSLAPVQKTQLPYSSRQVKVSVLPSMTVLNPAAYGDTLPVSPYRGYAAIGFMPMYNLGASAGYEIVDTDKTRLNGWVQYDGTTYKGTYFDGGDKRYVRRNTATLGLTLHQAVGRESFVDVGADYTFSRYNMPVTYGTANQNVHRANLSAMWTLRHGDMNYGLGGTYGHFGYANALFPSHDDNMIDWKPARENRFSLTGYVSGKIAGAKDAGLKVGVSNVNNTAHGIAAYHDGVHAIEAKDGFNHTLLTIHPYYKFEVQRLLVELGARVELTFNCGKAFHVAPAASVTWLPSSFVKAYVKATGGERQNTLASVFDVTPYTSPLVAYRNSHVPLDAEVGVTVGMWKGFHAEIAAGYSIANDWLMPEMTLPDYSMFAPVNMKGYKLHLAAGYNYRNRVDAKIAYEMAPQKYDRGYYMWRDRAKTVVNADLRVTPIERLDVTLGWEYRGNRASMARYISDAGESEVLRTSLGSVSNINAGALYRITPRWSVFLKGENLLNRHYTLIGGMPAQGITGLAGVTYKF